MGTGSGTGSALFPVLLLLLLLPGSVPRSLPGSLPGSSPGSPPGSVPGSSPGFPPGSPPGSSPGFPPGSPPGSSPGSPPGSVPAQAAPRAPSKPACGQRPFLGSFSSSRVVGGQDARVGAWPWSVSLQISEGHLGYAHICGGVLVKENSVLTAAHCTTARTDPYSWRAVLGAHNLWRPDKHTVRRGIKSITVHPGFERQLFEHDIALFELAAAVSYSPYIQPICLPPAQLQPGRDNNTKCFISGWGRTAEKGKTSAVLQEAQVEIIPSSVCSGAEAYGALVNSNMICAGSPSGGTDTCQGDSGGPLACYYPSAGQYYLLGIASFGVGCGRRKFPGIYVRVSQYRTWIKAELQLSSKAESPGSKALSTLLALSCVALVWTF